LGNETVEMFIVWSRNVKVATADIVDSFVVDQEGAVGMLDSAVSRENRVVWFNDGRRDLRRRVDGELQLALLAIVDRQSLEEKSTKTGACATTERVEDQETLQGRAVVCDATNFVQDIINQLFANGVVTSSVVVCGILLATNQEFGVEELSVWTGSNFVDWGGVEIDENGTRNMFVVAGLGEEGLKRTRIADVGVRVRSTISLQTVLEEV
jgi:hypothetical protein